MNTLPHRLERTLVIQARPDTVFGFFTSSERWAAWWGVGSTIDPTPGGRVYIRYPNGVEALGAVVEMTPLTRFVYTIGFVSGTPVGPGESRVTIVLAPHPNGTTLTLTHEFADATVCAEHVQGWRYQLSLFANVVADTLHARAATTIDAWFRLWADPDPAARAAALGDIASPGIRFGDRFSLVTGGDDLLPHIAATQRFMPGLRLERTGDVRQCHGTVLADWVARAADGAERGRGTNVFRLDADGRIHDVVGLWAR